MPAPPGLGAMPTGGGYEFDMMQNQKIGKCASRAKTWGVLSIVFGGLMLLGGIGILIAVPSGQAVLMAAVLVPIAAVYLGAGFFYISSGGALQQVVDTQGNDVALLLQGLNKMANAFFVEIGLTVIAILAVVVIVIAN